MRSRPCCRVACSRRAEYTLTFDYEDRMAAVGPLAVRSEPHSYDLCALHAGRTTVPEGWTLVKPTPIAPGAGDARALD
ncbi:DUF3499 family protein [Gulosibacter sp. 10]|uniref:DUF3499 family protein n=1 Tax=Gulosibacter sp. 10 TaxID=1255570 RepID=UPI000B352ED0|nr:DUF3499 family protein [Gulosibacter sp. 10]